MKKSCAAVCGELLIVALAAGCATAQAPSAAWSPASPAVSSPSSSRSASRPAVAASNGFTQRPGGAVPAGFRAASVTFVSTREASALGTAPCPHAPCTSIARSLDRVAVLAPAEHGRPRRVLSLGEVKWDQVMSLGHVERLSRARDLLAVRGFDTRDTVLTCYSGAGFDRELQAGQRHDIRLVGLDQLYANQGLSVR